MMLWLVGSRPWKKSRICTGTRLLKNTKHESLRGNAKEPVKMLNVLYASNVIKGHTVFRGLDWTGLDWTSKTWTSKTWTGKTRTSKTRTGKMQTSKTRTGKTRTSKRQAGKTRTQDRLLRTSFFF